MLKDKVYEAYSVAKKAHSGQLRKYSNKPYFTHVKYVARTIEDLFKDEDLIIVSLLHDTIEDTDITYTDIYMKFGKKIADLVLELTSGKIENMTKAEYLTKKMNNMSDDALLVKLADRLNNVKYLDRDCKTRDHLNFVKKYYLETFEILKNLKSFNGNSREKEIKILISGILFNLEYLECKHKW